MAFSIVLRAQQRFCMPAHVSSHLYADNFHEPGAFQLAPLSSPSLLASHLAYRLVGMTGVEQKMWKATAHRPCPPATMPTTMSVHVWPGPYEVKRCCRYRPTSNTLALSKMQKTHLCAFVEPSSEHALFLGGIRCGTWFTSDDA